MPARKGRRLPEVGSTFEKRFRNKRYVLRVVNDGGKIAFELDGRIFSSPSSAATSLTQTSVNGWAFWKID